MRNYQLAPSHDDGLDADGFQLVTSPAWRFVHGSEADAGAVQFISIAEATLPAIDRIRLIMNVSPACDSPIEAQLGAAVLTFFERAGAKLRLCKSFSLQGAPDGLLLVPQFAWSVYRSDWALLSARSHGALLVECDGKEFHSSPAQKAHDAKKDQAALDYGYLTLRFTGSAIFRDPDGCAQKIYDAVNGC